MKTFLMSFMQSPIVRRWVDMLLLAACLLVFGLVFQAPLSKVPQEWLRYSSSMVPVVSYAATLSIVALLSVLLIRLGAIGPQFRITTMLRYPLVWLY